MTCLTPIGVGGGGATPALPAMPTSTTPEVADGASVIAGGGTSSSLDDLAANINAGGAIGGYANLDAPFTMVDTSSGVAAAAGASTLLAGAAGAPTVLGGGAGASAHGTSMSNMAGMSTSDTAKRDDAKRAKAGTARTMKGHHNLSGNMSMVERTKADDSAKALRNYETAFAEYGSMRRADVPSAGRNGNHLRLTKKEQQRYAAMLKREGLSDLLVPDALMFPSGNNPNDKPLAIVYHEEGFTDLGLGHNHHHSDAPKNSTMQHIWLTGTQDLGFAFADAMVQKQALKRANQLQNGR